MRFERVGTGASAREITRKMGVPQIKSISIEPE
jgi:hypothetical protein